MNKIKSLIIKKIKKYAIPFAVAIPMLASLVIFEEEIQECKYFLWANFSQSYEQHKAIIEPYFDEQFYLSKYSKAVKKSGLKAIDHFLQRGWQSDDWHKHTDPNPWFNTTLYKERLWPQKKTSNSKRVLAKFLLTIDESPFVNFLTQPDLEKHNLNIDIYANANELGRAWMAVEEFIRINKFAITLHLPEKLDKKEMTRFEPQTKRGLKIIHDNYKQKSFYQSDFIKNSNYNFCELKPQPKAIPEAAITYVKNDFVYLMHRLYNYTGWHKNGIINPLMINIAHYCDEPIIFARSGNWVFQIRRFLKNLLRCKWNYQDTSQQNFKDYLVRISDGFDLCLINSKLPIKNLKIIPGFLHAYVNTEELDKTKKFGISYLLSLGGASLEAYRQKSGFNYKLRKDIWDYEEDFKIPTQFYLSFRDKDKYPKDLQNRVLPTDSKKWIFNSQFSIAIENTQQEDYFTEKLLGCFISLSVPIYIGCPNILDYFDAKGMIIVNSLQELITVANSLTDKTYQKMLPHLEKNRERSLKFLNLENETITEFFKNKINK